MRRVMASGAAAIAFLAATGLNAQIQSPGDGWITSPGPARMVRVLYWKDANQTEVWVRITPRNTSGVEIPADLVFSALFKGDVSKAGAITRPPDQITLLAQAHPLAFYVTPTLKLAGDDKKDLQLSAPGGHVMYGGGCETCSTNSVRYLMNAETLTAVTQSSKISGNVLGMTCHLEREDLDAIHAFAKVIGVVK